jgi:hypothetical protein
MGTIFNIHIFSKGSILQPVRPGYSAFYTYVGGRGRSHYLVLYFRKFRVKRSACPPTRRAEKQVLLYNSINLCHSVACPDRLVPLAGLRDFLPRQHHGFP